MIDCKNKPEGAQRHDSNSEYPWLKQYCNDGTIYFWSDNEWLPHVDIIHGLRCWNNAVHCRLELTWDNAADQASHILQHKVDGRQEFAIELINGEFKDFSGMSIYNMKVWSVLSERPVYDKLLNKYDRWLYSKCGKRVIVDVYRVLDAFEIKCPIRSHAAKKELTGGTRGHKDELQDLYDIRDSINEAIKLKIQKDTFNNA